jgi:hypothetical protein
MRCLGTPFDGWQPAETRAILIQNNAAMVVIVDSSFKRHRHALIA